MIHLSINHLKIFFFLLIILSSPAAAQLEPILNDISTDSIIQTIKELTGAVPIQLEGELYTIKTRAHLSTYNRLAQKYIGNKLKQHGVQTDELHFHSYSYFIVQNLTFTGAGYNANSTLPYWFCTNYGEIFASEVFPPVLESKKISGVPIKDRLDWIAFSGTETVAVMGNTGNFYLSTNNGETWTYDSTGFNSLAGFIIAGNHFIAAAKKDKIFRSADAGITWTTVSIDNLFGIADLISLSNNVIIAAGKDTASNLGKVYKSTDYGASWTPIQYSFEEPLVSCTSIGTEFWIAGKSGKIYYGDGQNNFALIYSPAGAQDAKKVVFADQVNGWLQLGNNHFYRTINKGYNWTEISSIDTPNIISDFLFINSDTGIVVGDDYYGIVTNDGGSTWKDETVPLAFDIIASIPGTSEPEKVIDIIAHSDCIMNIPERTGWIECPGADDDASGTAALIELARVLKDYPLKYTVNFIFTPDEELGGEGGCAAAEYILQSSDSILLSIELDMVGYDPQNESSLLIFYPNLSIYNGMVGRINSWLNSFGVSLNTKGEAGGTGSMVCLHYAYTQFSLFEDFRNPMNPNYHQITDTWNTLNPDYLTNVTKASALISYYFAAGELLDAEDNKILTADYYLSDAYPNPFNSKSIINFSIPREGRVSIKVYSILGNEVAVLIDKDMPAGEHSTEFNASHLSSGVYFYKMESDNCSLMKKLIYLK